MSDKLEDEADAFGDDLVSTGSPLGLAAPSTPVGKRPRQAGTYFGSSDEWFRRYWRHTYRRRVSARGTGNGRWAGDWWNYDEARQRLDALWLAWEAARADPAALSGWWLQHADPQMTALLAADGCFAAASGENHPGDPLPYQPPPPGLFPPDRTADNPTTDPTCDGTRSPPEPT